MKKEGIFDLADADGYNDSERNLISLCRNSFLSLWALPNTFTSEGLREGQSSCSEFTDVLVVFGDDVILFSDKEIGFSEDKEIGVAWARWYKKAVINSVSQLYGARNWAINNPEKIYLDAKCTRPLPVQLPRGDQARFHLVATTRGSTGPCAKAFGGGPGTFIIDTSADLEASKKTPFVVGLASARKPFVHIFDEKSLALLLRELDTATDFLRYLKARESFLSNSFTKIVAMGEEQLLAAYLSYSDNDSANFTSKETREKNFEVLIYDESHFSTYILSREYRERKSAERGSYAWDRQINDFITLGDPAYSGYLAVPNKDVEHALRIMASESRFHRSILTSQFDDFWEGAKKTPHQIRTRLLWTEQRKDTAYFYLVMPFPQGVTKEEYRFERAACLRVFCQCVPLRAPGVKKVVGIALDHPVRGYKERSEDLLVVGFDDYTEEDLIQLRQFADKYGIFPGNIEIQTVRSYDHPGVSVGNLKPSLSKSEKNKAKAMRRKNR
ncbi:hypothetical protein [Xanthomonas campestris]|uniref:hypothetical protein n=1 Tax=Xanthomonas campestris TaxID=339 RepID=UPI003CE94531